MNLQKREGTALSGVDWGSRKVLTMEEVSKHNTPDDCWMVLRGAVYNVTRYLPYHPGGADELLRGAGRSGDELFDEIHSWLNIDGFLAPCKVGVLDAGTTPPRTLLAAGGRTMKTFIKGELVRSSPLTHNSKRLQFRLDTPFSYELGQHVKLQISVRGGRLLNRPYTPLQDPERSTMMDLLIKVYEDGDVTPHLGRLEVGSAVKFSIAGSPVRFLALRDLKHLGLLAAGTGIAPFVAIIRHYLAIDEGPHITLLFVNPYQDDILLRDLFDEWAKLHPTRFRVYYALTQPPPEWNGLRGRPDVEMIREHMPPSSSCTIPAFIIFLLISATQILVCGPVRMVNSLTTLLQGEGLGYDSKHVVPMT